MTEYIARCRYDTGDRIAAGTYLSKDVLLKAYREGDIVSDAVLTPDDAREFARGILALADELDPPARRSFLDPPRVAAFEDEEDETIWEGDTVMVLHDCANMADVKAGDTFKVKKVLSNIGFDVYAPDRADGDKWFFTPENVVKVADEPATPTRGPADGQQKMRLLTQLRAESTPIVGYPGDEDDEPAETAPAFVNPERRAILTEAQSLVGSRDVPQLLDVARFLAGDPR